MKAVPASRYAEFLLIAIGGCALDLWTKHWIFHRLGMPGGPTLWIVEPYFGLQTSLNEGALFGLGQGNVALFATLSGVAAIAITAWLFWSGAARDHWLNLALSLVMAGILGNLYDRLGLWSVPDNAGVSRSAVRDWILWQYRDWVWPNFNLADSFLVCGAALLILHSFWHRGDEQPASAAAA